jgi:CheY-like chemotaxis protein
MIDPKPTVLLVEDNQEDVFLLRRAFRRENVDCLLQTAEDGEEAIAYLGSSGKYADRAAYPFPSLVLLDLKLPYVTGFEVLAWIGAQPACKNLRVVILTSSGEERDRERARQFGVRDYYLKPPTSELIATVVKVLRRSNEPVTT